MLADVERVKVIAEGHEHAAVVGVFLGDQKPEHIAVEPFGSLLVGDPQIDVADACQFDDVGYPISRLLILPRVSRRRPLRKCACTVRQSKRVSGRIPAMAHTQAAFGKPGQDFGYCCTGRPHSGGGRAGAKHEYDLSRGAEREA
jgi:hypothetical protein